MTLCIIAAEWSKDREFAEAHGCQAIALLMSTDRGCGQLTYWVYKRDFADIPDLLGFITSYEDTFGKGVGLYGSAVAMVAANEFVQPDLPPEIGVLAPFGIMLDFMGN